MISFKEIIIRLSVEAVPFYIPPAMHPGSNCSISLPILIFCFVVLFMFIIGIVGMNIMRTLSQINYKTFNIV